MYRLTDQSCSKLWANFIRACSFIWYIRKNAEEHVLPAQILPTSPRTLVDALPMPRIPEIAEDTLKVLLGSVLVAALSQVSIPLAFTPIPLTGQTFGVLLCGISLGARRGVLALALYLLAGAIGLPIFAGGGLGATHLIGPTAGYLWAFPLIALLVGWLAERGWGRNLYTTALCMTIGSLLLLTLGSLWLSLYVGGFVSGFQKGMLPFLPAEAIKIVFATGLIPGLWKWGTRSSH